MNYYAKISIITPKNVILREKNLKYTYKYITIIRSYLYNLITVVT